MSSRSVISPDGTHTSRPRVDTADPLKLRSRGNVASFSPSVYRAVEKASFQTSSGGSLSTGHPAVVTTVSLNRLDQTSRGWSDRCTSRPQTTGMRFLFVAVIAVLLLFCTTVQLTHVHLDGLHIRRWKTVSEKLAIVQLTLKPGASVAEVARKRGVNGRPCSKHQDRSATTNG